MQTGYNMLRPQLANMLSGFHIVCATI